MSKNFSFRARSQKRYTFFRTPFRVEVINNLFKINKDKIQKEWEARRKGKNTKKKS